MNIFISTLPNESLQKKCRSQKIAKSVINSAFSVWVAEKYVKIACFSYTANVIARENPKKLTHFQILELILKS